MRTFPKMGWRQAHTHTHITSLSNSLAFSIVRISFTSSTSTSLPIPVTPVLSCPLEAEDMAIFSSLYKYIDPSCSRSLSTIAKQQVVRTWLLLHMCSNVELSSNSSISDYGLSKDLRCFSPLEKSFCLGNGDNSKATDR